MLDAYGRDIHYLRISITDLCNLRCQYCMPVNGVEKKPHEEILSLEEINQIVGAFVNLGIDKIRLTGGEPLVRKGIVSLVEQIKKYPQIKDLTLTTNGLLLKQMAKPLKDAGLNRINISLDTLDEEKYRMMTRGGNLKDVLAGIEEAIKVGLTPIKINAVLIGGFNDNEIEKFVEMTRDQAIDVRFIELMPIGEVATWSLDHFLPNAHVLDKVPELMPDEVEKGAPATYYKLSNGKGRVGLISPISCKFCEDCNRVRLTADGKLKYCLHSNEEFDLKKVLREGQPLEPFIRESVLKKPLEHVIEEGKYIQRNMVQVGG